MQRLRCNACGQIFSAEAPQSAGGTRYDATAIAMLALLIGWVAVVLYATFRQLDGEAREAERSEADPRRR